MPLKLTFAVFTLAVIPLLYVNIWLGLASAIATYAVAARLATKSMDKAHSEAFRRVRPRPN